MRDLETDAVRATALTSVGGDDDDGSKTSDPTGIDSPGDVLRLGRPI